MMSVDDLKEDQQDNLLNELRSKDNDDEKEEAKEGDESAGNVSETYNINKTTNLEDEKGKKEAIGKRGSINHDDNDHYEEFLHPNMRQSVVVKKDPKDARESEDSRRKRFNSCKECFRRFDELIMKPFFIYQYDKELISKKADFMDLFLQEADQLEQTYVKEEFDPKALETTRNQRGNSVYNRISEMARRNSVMRASVRASVRSISA